MLMAANLNGNDLESTLTVVHIGTYQSIYAV
jgi:hypothetical protein